LPILWWSKTLLVRNSGFEEMAFYDVAEQWNMMLLFIPNSISSILLPLLTNVLSVGTQNQYRKLININLIVNGGVTLLLALIIIPLAPYILKLYGNNFTNYIPLRIMLLTAVLQAINAVLGQVIASKGKMWDGFILNLCWALIISITALLFIKNNLGAIGLSIAVLISYISHTTLVLFYILKNNKK
jgi:O-antigen/teichoic acid export membrane protein